jgi:hypothetical protein
VHNPRVLLAAGVVVVAIVVGVVVLAFVGGDSGDGGAKAGAVVRPTLRARLTLEQYQRPDTGERELLVSLPGPRFNVEDAVRGVPIVWLRCFDAAGAMAIRSPYDWPLLEEPGYPPHIHQPADGHLLATVRRCRLTAPGVDFEGTVSGRLPVAQ